MSAWQAAPPTSGAHGALDVAAQQQRLDALHTATTGVPPGVDPVAWTSIYVPSDNQPTPGRIDGRAANYDDVGRAIASFERTLIFLDAPFDKYVAGDSNAISPAAQRGLVLFGGKARCVSCHMLNSSNPLGTDNLFHNIGVSARKQNFEAPARKGLALNVMMSDPGWCCRIAHVSASSRSLLGGVPP